MVYGIGIISEMPQYNNEHNSLSSPVRGKSSVARGQARGTNAATPGRKRGGNEL
jgi:hypothetical protein